jgi:hypothetical protein
MFQPHIGYGFGFGFGFGDDAGVLAGVKLDALQGQAVQVPFPHRDPCPGATPAVIPVKTSPELLPRMPGVPGFHAITGLSTAVVTSSAAAIIIRYIMILMSFSNPSESEIPADDGAAWNLATPPGRVRTFSGARDRVAGSYGIDL